MTTTRAHRDSQAALRVIEALRLRKTGMLYRDIAAAVGYADAATVSNAITRELKRQTAEAVDDLRTLETLRLDQLLEAIYPRAIGGSLKAVDRVLRIMDRRARLMGLDLQHEEAGGGQVLVVDIYRPQAAATAEAHEGSA